MNDENDEFTFHIARYRPEELQKLASKTKFTRKEIQLMYRGFKQVGEGESKERKMRVLNGCIQCVHKRMKGFSYTYEVD
ncbi:hypothetical protein NQ315_010065 [Exocentrus adspersus]|uniref:Uncharacterized protein n=1 Tax=Exocentrus adspersus TaxID=1586481 RepID=A0AAV8WAY3_9CUCU|nr:hypothetical protein NQ315_010065 [Exocentrus adspersus]